jgi:hypothetical protein
MRTAPGILMRTLFPGATPGPGIVMRTLFPGASAA